MSLMQRYFLLMLLILNSAVSATTQIEIRDNPALSSSVANLSSVRAARSGGLTESIFVRDISTEDLRYSIVPLPPISLYKSIERVVFDEGNSIFEGSVTPF